jgi:hypothetical protein
VRLWDPTGQPHGAPLTDRTDATVRLWETATGRAEGEPLRGRIGAVWSMAISRDGALLVSTAAARPCSRPHDGNVQFCDATTPMPDRCPYEQATTGPPLLRIPCQSVITTPSP